ncbi:MAG: helix-turn-helix domain-containing protein [Halobacteriales archaeon]|nr:helix-turn-helix domain-containing protein [Halobacteriales archaeon]
MALPDVRLVPNPHALAGGASMSEMRRRVLECVTDHPSTSIAQVAQLLECSHTTASYHLAALIKQDLVISRKEGRLVRHYRAGSETTQARLAGLLADPRRRLILTHLVQAHTWPLNKLAKATGVNHGYLMRTLRILVDLGFAVLVRPLARSYAQPTETLREALRDLGIAPTATLAPAPEREDAADPSALRAAGTA